MAITYNKQKITKDRLVTPSGPRDHQLRQQMRQLPQGNNDELISELRNQISELQDRLAAKVPSTGGYTEEQVNDEIMKAIKSETASIKSKLTVETNKVVALRKEVESLKSTIMDKDKLIKQLESTPKADSNVAKLLEEATKKIEALAASGNFVSTSNASTNVSGRPQMETVFVDPIEKESNVESHFDVVEDVSITKKEEMNNKVNKLKNLLGKLPSKR